MGHVKQIDANLYKKFWKTHPQFVIDEYRKALPHLNLISGEAASKQQQDKVRALEERIAYIESVIAKSNREVDQALKDDS